MAALARDFRVALDGDGTEKGWFEVDWDDRSEEQRRVLTKLKQFAKDVRLAIVYDE